MPILPQTLRCVRLSGAGRNAACVDGLGLPCAAVLHGKSCVRRAPCTWKKRQKNRLMGFRRAVFGFCNFRNFAAKRLPCGRDGGFPSHIRPRTARQRMRCCQYATTDPFRRRGSRCNSHAWKADLGGILCVRGLCPRQGNQPFQLVVRLAEARTPFAARRANAKRERGRWRKFRACRLFTARGIAAFSLRPAAGRQAVRRMLALSAMLPGALSPARYCPLCRAPPAACPARIRAPRPAQPGLRP